MLIVEANCLNAKKIYLEYEMHNTQTTAYIQYNINDKKSHELPICYLKTKNLL